jgi:hypothetical protein
MVASVTGDAEVAAGADVTGIASAVGAGLPVETQAAKSMDTANKQ